MTQPPGSQKDACPSRPKARPSARWRNASEPLPLPEACFAAHRKRPRRSRDRFLSLLRRFSANAAHAVHIRNIRAVSQCRLSGDQNGRRQNRQHGVFRPLHCHFPVKRSLPLIQIESTKPPSALSLPILWQRCHMRDKCSCTVCHPCPDKTLIFFAPGEGTIRAYTITHPDLDAAGNAHDEPHLDQQKQDR